MAPPMTFEGAIKGRNVLAGNHFSGETVNFTFHEPGEDHPSHDTRNSNQRQTD